MNTFKQTHLNRFLALSYLYFVITEKPSQEIAAIDIEEWLEIINSDEEPPEYRMESVPGATALACVEALLPAKTGAGQIDTP